MSKPLDGRGLRLARRAALILTIVAVVSVPLVVAMVVYRTTQLERRTFGDGSGERVLFLGNSLTYFHDMPGMVAALSRSAASPKRFDPTMIVRGGALLQTLLHQRAVESALEEPWVAVILQPQSLEPTSRCNDKLPRVRLRDLRRWSTLESKFLTVVRFMIPNLACARPLLASRVSRAARALRARGVQTLLYWFVPYGPWHVEYRYVHPLEHTMRTLGGLEQLSAIAAMGGAELPAVTSAFLACDAKLSRLSGSLRLLDADQNHPTLAGSYFVAWMLFDALTGRGNEPVLRSWWVPETISAEHAQWIRACATRWHEYPAIFRDPLSSDAARAATHRAKLTDKRAKPGRRPQRR